MQARAIFRAEGRLLQEGFDPHVEVMIPLVGIAAELEHMATLVAGVNEEVARATGRELPYQLGTMIEVPRAALTAAEIAPTAQFFSFGTNDLTQTTFGYSRDDAESKFLPTYLADKILTDNPFVTLDQPGVGRLIEWAVADGRRVRPDLHIGICGEHGGDPASIAFCHRVGLDYVSCSPYRVPIARLSAAQAALQQR
jgi:pyruvate,orthophosphate dikinase